MSKGLRKIALTLGAVAGATVLMVEPAMAQTIGDVAGNAKGSLDGIKSLLLSFAPVVGVFAMIAAIFFFWKESKQPNQDFMKKGAFAFVAAILFFSIEFMASSGQETLIGADATATIKGNGSNTFTNVTE